MIIFHLLLRKAGGMEAKKANHKWNRFLLRGAGDKNQQSHGYCGDVFGGRVYYRVKNMARRTISKGWD